MYEALKNIIGLTEEGDSGKGRLYIDYKNSIFSKIFVPVFYFLILDFHGFFNLSSNLDIFRMIRKFISSIPNLVLNLIYLLFSLIYNVLTPIYSNYECFFIISVVSIIAIFFWVLKEYFIK